VARYAGGEVAMTDAVIVTGIVCATVAFLSGLAVWFRMQKPPAAVEPRVAALETAVSDALDKHTALQRSHDEQIDKHVSLRRVHDDQLYELETQMRRITREREEDKARFDAKLADVETERNKLSHMMSQRLPHARM
jgi:hypothetical protein